MQINAKTLGLSGIAALALIAGGVLFGLAGITDIKPGEVGIQVKMLGSDRGMQPDVLNTGTRWVNPLTYDVDVYNFQKKQYGGEKLTDIPSQTSDGQPVLVDISLEIGLTKSKTPILHTEVGKDWYESVVYPALRSAVRDIVPTASSDEVYTEKGRATIDTKISAALSAKGKPYGIDIDVNLRAIDFTNEKFIAKLEAKAIAQQNIEIERRKALAAENTATKTANLAEGDKQARIKAAEAGREEARLEGEGRRLKKEEDAKGILAVATAEAEGIRLRREAYAGNGGAELVSIAWAENLGPNIKVYGIPTGAPGTSSVMDLNGLLNGAFKGMQMPVK